jgi:hypothetical protein
MKGDKEFLDQLSFERRTLLHGLAEWIVTQFIFAVRYLWTGYTAVCYKAYVFISDIQF